jgi:hypothetical protein
LVKLNTSSRLLFLLVLLELQQELLHSLSLVLLLPAAVGRAEKRELPWGRRGEDGSARAG